MTIAQQADAVPDGLPPVRGYVDTPVDGDLVQQYAFALEGWAYAEEDIGRRELVVVVEDLVIGSTQLVHERSDVARAYGRPEMACSGFWVACSLPEHLRDRRTIQVRVALVNDRAERHEFAALWLRLSRLDYRPLEHGEGFSDGTAVVKHRADIYRSGPPSVHADPRAVQLVRRYLQPSERVLDVGCGIGAYGRVLAPLGYDWTGCEVRADFVAETRSVGLPAVHVGGDTLPFQDDCFDAALCIEVLEHVEQYERFLAEIARVVKRRAVFSVPNFETVSMLSLTATIPWHMLEGDHKNFFTRGGLARTLRAAFARVEVFEYGPLDAVRTQDDLPVYNHLFAVADRG